mmetsp:Transcript_39530/g.97220  ORF Transcript_39530/g.97220 Transcript_39530/m.97220 type:complete len:230 (+) Transcript_39530:1090-1779(+)
MWTLKRFRPSRSCWRRPRRGKSTLSFPLTPFWLLLTRPARSARPSPLRTGRSTGSRSTLGQQRSSPSRGRLLAVRLSCGLARWVSMSLTSSGSALTLLRVCWRRQPRLASSRSFQAATLSTPSRRQVTRIRWHTSPRQALRRSSSSRGTPCLESMRSTTPAAAVSASACSRSSSERWSTCVSACALVCATAVHTRGATVQHREGALFSSARGGCLDPQAVGEASLSAAV